MKRIIISAVMMTAVYPAQAPACGFDEQAAVDNGDRYEEACDSISASSLVCEQPDPGDETFAVATLYESCDQDKPRVFQPPEKAMARLHEILDGPGPRHLRRRRLKASATAGRPRTASFGIQIREAAQWRRIRDAGRHELYILHHPGRGRDPDRLNGQPFAASTARAGGQVGGRSRRLSEATPFPFANLREGESPLIVGARLGLAGTSLKHSPTVGGAKLNLCIGQRISVGISDHAGDGTAIRLSIGEAT